MHIEEIISKNLKHYRAEADVTQERIAKICGVSTQQIRDVEAGRKKPSIDLLVRIASALHIESSLLLEQGEPKTVVRPLPFKNVLGMYANVPERIVRELAGYGPKDGVWGMIEDAIEARKAEDDGDEGEKQEKG